MALSSKSGSKDPSMHPSFVTLNKDGKPVWEPGLRAEITSRRQPRVKRKPEEPEEGPVPCDLKNTLKLSPEARAAWLTRALGAIPKGRAKAQEVYDIITNRKFPSGVPDETGHAMLRQVKESLMFFTEKQQLHIAKSRLVKEFKPMDPHKRAGRRRHEDEDSSDDRSMDDDAPPRPPPRPVRRHFSEADRREDDDMLPRPHVEAPPLPKEIESPTEQARDSDLPKLSPEERARIERESAEREAERQRKRVQELKRLEAERKAQKEREAQRKAKIGSAFLMGGEEDEEPAAAPLGRLFPVERRRDDSLRLDEESPLGGIKYSAPAASSSGAGVAVTTSAIQTMGGDSIVSEAQQILQRGAGAFLAKREREQRERRPSRSRSRRRRRSPSRSHSRSPSRHKGVVADDRRRRVWDSLRSPTPDGHLRGQMRAARKAKMMAQMLQQGNVPRVT